MYVPDPASVGQHMADVAVEMARRGWRVVVLTSRNEYDDPRTTYPATERRTGVEIRRLPWCSFGKASIAIRVLGGLSFLFQAIIHGLLVGPVDLILVSTVPPMASLGAVVLGWLKRAGIKYWVMDVNPDQLVALGRMTPTATAVRMLDRMNRWVLARADHVIVLDRFMADRVNAKRDIRGKLSIIPPWPLDDHLAPVSHDDNPFREAHGLAGKFVVMHSGNHGLTNPFDTVLRAAARLEHDARLVFLFVGGGVGKRGVEQAGLSNVRSLPYQPLEALRYSLSAADVHLVTMGDGVVGIVHPCKVYGALAVGRPIVFLGPAVSHVGDLLARDAVGWGFRHGDVDGAVRRFQELLELPAEELLARGRRGQALVEKEFSKALLCGRLCDVLERRT